METLIASLVDQLDQSLRACPPNQRYIVAISGSPAVGKTVLTSILAEEINKRWSMEGSNNEGEVCVVVGVDGWHHTRAHLDTMDDPQEAHRVRGALYTFDGPSYLNFVRSLRADTTSKAPSFSHALKDPVVDAIEIKPLPKHKLVILEGLWTTLRRGEDGKVPEEWEEAARSCDERWTVLPATKEMGGDGVEGVRERLIARHLRTGVSQTLEEATARGKVLLPAHGSFQRR